MPPREHIVIAGASLAAHRALTELRRLGFEGRITLIGAEKHYPYDRPPLSKQILQGTWEPVRTLLDDPDHYNELRADLLRGRQAVALHAGAREVELDDGTRVAYDALLIATGASPRTLPNTPALAGIHTLRTMDDALALRAAFDSGAKVCVIGAGFIGAEVAASARGRGLEVTMLEALDQPLARVLGAKVGAAVAEVHRAQGVDLRCGATVTGFEGSERVEAVILADGSKVAADVVVVGIGVRPNTAWLVGSGIELDDGVLCDATLATNVAGVWAAGDVARWQNPHYGEHMRAEHWTSAVEQGMAVAANILRGPGAGEPHSTVPYVWSDQYDISIQVYGHPRPGDEVEVVLDEPDAGKVLALFGRDGKLSAAAGWGVRPRLTRLNQLLEQHAPWTLALSLAHE
ncbi:MAG: FAD-dependent oxidoreductase [Dehalococcoidia bacterium]|nr:FAD-dependent oxidoreductase [Dehalococcoidia bacterium]